MNEPADQFNTRPRPRVSVISSFLNAEAYLKEAVESVLGQTLSDWELILVDDGSTDASTTIAKGYAARDPRIMYLEHEGHVNRGLSASRNAGLAVARGEFVAFIDADDVWLPNKLVDQIAIADHHPEVAMVCGTVNYWRTWNGEPDRIVPTGHLRDTVINPPDASIHFYPLGQADAPCPSDLLLRRAAVQELDGFEEHFTGAYEDQAFLGKLYLFHRIYCSSKIWLNYRQHNASMMSGVYSSNSYHQVRAYYLDWFSQYLKGKKGIDWRVKLKLWIARAQYTSPELYGLIKLRRRVGRALRTCLRRVTSSAG